MKCIGEKCEMYDDSLNVAYCNINECWIRAGESCDIYLLKDELLTQLEEVNRIIKKLEGGL